NKHLRAQPRDDDAVHRRRNGDPDAVQRLSDGEPDPRRRKPGVGGARGTSGHGADGSARCRDVLYGCAARHRQSRGPAHERAGPRRNAQADARSLQRRRGDQDRRGASRSPACSRPVRGGHRRIPTLNTSRAAYRQIIGMEPVNLAPGSPVDRFSPRVLSAAIDTGLTENPNVTAAMYGVDVAFLQVKINEGALFPNLSLQGNVQYASFPQLSV